MEDLARFRRFVEASLPKVGTSTEHPNVMYRWQHERSIPLVLGTNYRLTTALVKVRA